MSEPTPPLRRNSLDLDRALAAAKADFVQRNPASAALHAEAADVMPGGNTRTVLFYDPFPLVMRRGEGSRLFDADGHAYVDFLGEYSAGLYGHSHPAIRAAIYRTLDDGVSLGAHTVAEVELARAVRARFPAMELLRFTNSGTEANLMAIAAARAETGRTHLMVFEGAYHGAGLAFPGGGTGPGNLPFPSVIAPYNDIETATALIRRHAGELCAVLVEPMLGAGGCIPATSAFLRALRAATERCGVLLVFDEVMTSRLAPGGLQQVHAVEPDLTTLGKYLGGGMSFGAFGGRARIMQRFDPRRAGALPHAGTFNNNVLSMRAGLAGLTEVFTPQAAVELNARGDELRKRLNALCRSRHATMQFTGQGSLMTAHFQVGALHSASDLAGGDPRLKELLFFHLLSHGIYAARRAMFTLSLPLDAADHQALVDAVAGFLDRFAGFLDAKGVP